MKADAMRLLYNTGVRWVSEGNVLKWLFQRRQELRVFFAQQAPSFQDNY